MKKPTMTNKDHRTRIRISQKEMTDRVTELIADCHGGTDVNLVTALGFYSMFGSLESLLNLEQKHEMVTAISVEVFP